MSDHNDSIIFTDAMMTGPGSQPAEADGAEIDILQLPSGMDTFESPILPEPEDVAHLEPAKKCLSKLLLSMQSWQSELPNVSVDIDKLDAENLDLIDQVLGEGEVSLMLAPEGDASKGVVRIQESVLTGVWRIRYFDENEFLVHDSIQVGPIPDLIYTTTFYNAKSKITETPESLPEGVSNAPPLLAEINERLESFNPENGAHTINLTLLPQTEQDLMYLDTHLGLGNTTILSRGYGNCRITSTGTKNVWWVRYFNSQDKNILNSLEISDIPEVACAAIEDIADSAVRLREILEIYL